jgi:hypothetical protein
MSADELLWTVPGDLATPVDVDDGCTVLRSFPLGRELPGRVDALMLEQDEGVGPVAGHDLGVDPLLHVPGGVVLDGSRGQAELLVAVTGRQGIGETEADHVEHVARVLRPVHCG